MVARMIRQMTVVGLAIWLTACASPPSSATSTPSVTSTAPPTRAPTSTPGSGLSELLATPVALAANTDLQGAKTAYRALIELYPHRAEPWLGLAALSLQQGDQEAALGYLNRAIQAQSDSLEAYRQLALLTEQRREFARLPEIYQKMLTIAPDDPDLLLAYAAALSRAGDSAGAIEAMTQAESLQPDRAYSWVTLASAASSARQYATAIAVASEGLNRHPKQPSMQIERGLAYLSISDAQSALVDFDTVLADDPANFSALRWRGRALSELGRSEEAISALQSAAKLGQLSGAISFNESYDAMADAADQISQSDAGAAFDYLAQQVIQHGSRDALLLGYARVRWRQGHTAQAITQLNSLILSGYIPALYWRGLIYARIGERELAASDLRAYLAVYKSGPDAEAAYRLLDSLGE